MSTPLRLLVVEDSQEDAELAVRELKRSEFKVEYTRVDTPEALREALVAYPWDIILSDYSMPRFSGRAAFEIVRETGFDIPFIFLSGTIGEERAVEAMRLGVSDYVLKDNMTRLVPAVRRELKEAESRKRRREAESAQARLMAAVEHSSDMVIMMDRNCMIEYVNPAVCRILGYTREELIGADGRMLKSEKVSDAEVAEINRKVWVGEPWTGRLFQRAKSGEDVETSYTITPIVDGGQVIVGFVSDVRDITEEVKLQNQLRHAQKMEAIGTLAGGIAHDFNNILSAIIGYSELGLTSVPDGEPLREYLARIRQAGQRAAGLVRQILMFSRQAQRESGPVNVGIIVKEALKLLRASLPATVEMVDEVTLDDTLIFGDPTQIHQIVMNLCTNAYHAMRQGGRLSVRLHETSFDIEEPATISTLRPGKYCVLTVADTGQGMDEATIERIFDPYFTTKPVGEGTGLGLAIVHGIAKDHGGAVRVESEPGRGSTFQVFFPRLLSSEDVQTLDEQPMPRGTERVLFVDDEEVLVSLGVRILGNLGYHVTGTTSSVEALARFRESPDLFDVLVTDLTMPRLTGEELASEVRQTRPDFPVVMMTGFREESVIELTSSKLVQVLSKPLAARDLADAVRRALNAAHPELG